MITRPGIAQETDADAPVVETAVESEPGEQESAAATASKNEDTVAISENPDERIVSFAFEGTPWRDVVKWLAESADLALHIGDLPTGSFTYSDAGEFSPQQAIDRVNLFLMPEGFALIRSGKLLSLINLTDRRSTQQLDALAKLVPFEDLDTLEPHDVVKCLFPMGELKAADAVEELSALNLMLQPSVFPKTNQLLITDTVTKLRAAKTILDAFEPRTLDNGTVVKGFQLQYVNAEDVLTVARPHLGLATGETIGIDVSISTDILGKNIFVTGVEDKILLIEGIIKSIDVEANGPKSTNADAELKSYPVAGGNLETVYDVLQTLLSARGNEVRLSADREAETIVALAIPEIQAEIEQTIHELKASEAAFEVINLENVDPYLAISLIEQMLDLPDELFDDPDDIDPDAPKIDADPGNRRIFVRAKPSDIEEIKKIVSGLEEGSLTDARNRDRTEPTGIRIFPIARDQAERTLRTAATFWRGDNPVVYYPLPETDQASVTERVLVDEPEAAGSARPKASPIESSTALFLTDNRMSQAPPIRAQLAARGLLLQCNDDDALNLFEEHLRTIAGPTTAAASPPIVYYMKYTRPEEALKMLAELLDGGEAAKEAEAGSLVNGYVSSSSYYYSIIRSRDGTLSMVNDTITVVADTRLNRLIAQGTTKDIETIEGYLKIIDKDKSLTSIELYGRAHVIELRHAKAGEVAEALQQAYEARLASGAPQRGQGGGGNQGGRESSREADDDNEGNDKKSKKSQEGRATGGGGGGIATDLEPRMTIAVHEPSNSLIVTAPEALFLEVEALAKVIDERSRQTVNVIKLSDRVPIDVIREALGGDSPGRSRRRGDTSRGPRDGS